MSDVELSFPQVLERIGELADELTSWPDPKVRDRAAELLDWIDAFHRDGLGTLVEMIRAWRGEIFLENVAADEKAGALLAAYGLGEEPRDLANENLGQIAQAMEDVRPMVESHGGSIEVADVEDGVVKVRLNGTCNGCPSSAATLTYGVEAALRDRWAHFRRLEVIDLAETADPNKADLTCGVPIPAPPPPTPVSTPVTLTRRPAK